MFIETFLAVGCRSRVYVEEAATCNLETLDMNQLLQFYH